MEKRWALDFDGSSLDLMVFHDPNVYFVLNQSKG